MGLSCECDGDWEPEPGDKYCDGMIDYKPMASGRRKRCCSCKELINTGELVLEFQRVKVPDTDVEVKIYGEEGEIPIASIFMCETCGDLYLSLEELGYCNDPNEDQRELAKEYAHEHEEPKKTMEHAPGSI